MCELKNRANRKDEMMPLDRDSVIILARIKGLRTAIFSHFEDFVEVREITVVLKFR